MEHSIDIFPSLNVIHYERRLIPIRSVNVFVTDSVPDQNNSSALDLSPPLDESISHVDPAPVFPASDISSAQPSSTEIYYDKRSRCRSSGRPSVIAFAHTEDLSSMFALSEASL